MTIHTVPTVQHGIEITVPLSKLKRSPRNARKSPHRSEDIESLAASIAAKGILQPPVVEPELDGKGAETGCYFVTIGEGRRLALALLAKRKAVKKDSLVRCLLDTTNDAFEVSLDENVTRFAMHPADQFDAFRHLAEDKGWSAEDIAVRFGVTANVVRQRLRLAAVSPLLLARYREGALTLDQLMAFAISDDHERQEQVFDQLSFNRSPSLIRRYLTELDVDAAERRAVFIGPEAFQAAGGRIRRDLFAEDHGGWFEKVALLDRLVLEKLSKIAESLKVEEGWRWTEVHLDFPYDHGLRRVYPHPIEPDAETAAKIGALSQELDGLAERCESGELDPEAAEERSDAIEAELADLCRPVYSPEDRALAGVIVSLGQSGEARIDRGFIKPEDQPPKESEEDEAQAAEERPASGPKPLPERLVGDLTAHRTAGLRDTLAQAPEAALLAVTHALALSTFYRGYDASCLELRVVSVALGGYAASYAESTAGLAIQGRHDAWAERLPTEAVELWAAVIALSLGERLDLLAHCVSLSINAVRVPGRSRRALAHAEQLATHLGLDMTHYWQATSESYFARVNKGQIVEAVTEGKSPEAAAKLDGLKKDAMAIAAADLLGADGWLPPLLRTAAAGPA